MALVKNHISIKEFIEKSVILILIFLAPVCILAFNIDPKSFNILVLISAIFALPFFIKDLKNKRFLAFWAFYYSVIFFIYDLNYGLDMTDEPFQLVLSYFIPKNSIFTTTNPLSYQLIHYVLKPFHNPSYLLERLIAAIEFSLIIFFTVKSVLLIIDKKSLDIVLYILTLLTASTLTFNYLRFNIPYDQVPMVIFVILIYLGLSLIYKNSILNSLLLGLFFALSLYTRVTSFIFSIILIGIFAFVGKQKNILSPKVLRYFSFGVILGLALLAVLKVDLTLPILKYVHFDYKYCMPSNYEHSLKNITDHYLLDFQKTITYFLFIFPLIYLSNEILKKWNKSTFIIAIFLVLLSLLYAEFKFNGWSSDNFFSWFFLSFAIFISVYILIIVKTKHILWLDLLIIILTVTFAFAGSNVGFRKIAFNGALSFSIIYIILSNNLSKISKLALYGWLILIFGLGLSYRYNRFYRDYPKYKLTASFTNIQVLKGILTTKEKVNEIKDFYRKIKRLDLNNNYVTCNKTNIFELLINKKALSSCWLFNPKKLNAPELKPPKYVIFSNHSLRYFNWNKRNVLAIKRDLPIIIKTKHKLDSLYKPIIYSKHKIFVVYKLKN